jgi:excisionase family DNA binding protein
MRQVNNPLPFSRECSDGAAEHDLDPRMNQGRWLGVRVPREKVPLTALRQPTPTVRRLESISGAAHYAGVHPKTIRRRISDGSLTGYRFGPRIVRVDLNEVDAMLRPIPTGRGDA